MVPVPKRMQSHEDIQQLFQELYAAGIENNTSGTVINFWIAGCIFREGMIMFCGNCGKELEINIKFCPDCGAAAHVRNAADNAPQEEKISKVGSEAYITKASNKGIISLVERYSNQILFLKKIFIYRNYCILMVILVSLAILISMLTKNSNQSVKINADTKNASESSYSISAENKTKENTKIQPAINDAYESFASDSEEEFAEYDDSYLDEFILQDIAAVYSGIPGTWDWTAEDGALGDSYIADDESNNMSFRIWCWEGDDELTYYSISIGNVDGSVDVRDVMFTDFYMDNNIKVNWDDCGCQLYLITDGSKDVLYLIQRGESERWTGDISGRYLSEYAINHYGETKNDERYDLMNGVQGSIVEYIISNSEILQKLENEGYIDLGEDSEGGWYLNFWKAHGDVCVDGIFVGMTEDDCWNLVASKYFGYQFYFDEENSRLECFPLEDDGRISYYIQFERGVVKTIHLYNSPAMY